MGDQQARERRPHSPGEVHVDGAELSGRSHLVAWHHLGHERLVGGCDENRSCSDHEREHEQQRGRDPTGDGHRGEPGSGDDEAALHGHEQPSPVEGVCQHAADDSEHDIGEHVCGLHERDEDGGVCSVNEDPLGADGLHPGAHVAHERRQPQPSEDGQAKRRPC
jgi:hypothetical protein